MNVGSGETCHPRILLADDDHEFRELLTFSLTCAGYRVDSCSNGLDLLSRLENCETGYAEPYALVLTDVRMPGMTGIEVLEASAAFPERPPILCMTAFGDDLTHADARRLGAVLTIDKPFHLDDLIALIGTFCSAADRDLSQPRRIS